MLLLTISSVLLGVAVGLARRGSLERLANIRIRLWWLALAAWVLEAVVLASPLSAALAPVAAALLGLAMAIIGVVLALNWRVPGLGLFLLGLLLNALVMAANGGFMPVSEPALVAANSTWFLEEMKVEGRLQKSFPMQPDTPLWFLGDVVPIRLVEKVYSPGDLILAVGSFVMVVGGMGRGYRVTGDGFRGMDTPSSAHGKTGA